MEGDEFKNYEFEGHKLNDGEFMDSELNAGENKNESTNLITEEKIANFTKKIASRKITKFIIKQIEEFNLLVKQKIGINTKLKGHIITNYVSRKGENRVYVTFLTYLFSTLELKKMVKKYKLLKEPKGYKRNTFNIPPLVIKNENYENSDKHGGFKKVIARISGHQKPGDILLRGIPDKQNKPLFPSQTIQRILYKAKIQEWVNVSFSFNLGETEYFVARNAGSFDLLELINQKRSGKPVPEININKFIEIMGGLEDLHIQGSYLLDIKSSNIVYDEDADELRFIDIVDSFSNKTSYKRNFGTDGYMCEQFRICIREREKKIKELEKKQGEFRLQKSKEKKEANDQIEALKSAVSGHEVTIGRIEKSDIENKDKALEKIRKLSEVAQDTIQKSCDSIESKVSEYDEQIEQINVQIGYEEKKIGLLLELSDNYAFLITMLQWMTQFHVSQHMPNQEGVQTLSRKNKVCVMKFMKQYVHEEFRDELMDLLEFPERFAYGRFDLIDDDEDYELSFSLMFKGTNESRIRLNSKSCEEESNSSDEASNLESDNANSIDSDDSLNKIVKQLKKSQSHPSNLLVSKKSLPAQIQIDQDSNSDDKESHENLSANEILSDEIVGSAEIESGSNDPAFTINSYEQPVF